MTRIDDEFNKLSRWQRIRLRMGSDWVRFAYNVQKIEIDELRARADLLEVRLAEANIEINNLTRPAAAVDVHRQLMSDGKHLTLFDVTLVLDAIKALDK